MGTPDFAVASLDALLKSGCNIVAVVTAPDKPAGRGRKLSEPAVKRYAVEKGLQVLQPHKLKDSQFIETLKDLNADLKVIVAFRMLPEIVWAMSPKGTVNLHASLLPQYRGAAPINWAIINGETETGVTTFFLKQEIDTGDILFRKSVPINADETAGELHDKLMVLGAGLLVRTVKAIESGNYREIPQSEIEDWELDDESWKAAIKIENPEPIPGILHVVFPHKAPKIFKEDCEIIWNNPVETIYNRIRGLSPYPTAYTFLQGKTFKIFKAEKELTEPAIEAGELLTDNKTYLKFACKDGFIRVTDVQMEGKKRMPIDEFLRGVRL